ncbi:MAG: hypothetical protein CUN55_07685 [Phototrophicales bacterium]|nr:MAG: hypothetical protein CUN55_07685 [Phototrophicales bacterium]
MTEHQRVDAQPSVLPKDLKPQQSNHQNAALMLTAAIFFALGFVIAAIAFSGDDKETNVSSSSLDSVVVNNAVRSTLEALNIVDIDDEYTQRVNIAVQGTFMALTPTVTPTPTPIPVQQTFSQSEDPILGEFDAPVVMVEFASYTCGFCGRFHRETLPALLEHYGDQLAFVVRNFPRSDSEITLNVLAQCAYEQGDEKFWAFTDQFWWNQVESQLPLNDQTINLFIQNAQLDTEQLNTCLADEQSLNKVLDDRQVGLEWGVTGTPAFFINGVPVVGAQPLAYFQNIIDDLLRQQGIEPPSRT